MNSLFAKKQKQRRQVAVGSGATNLALGLISLPLDRAFLTSELIIGLSFSQTWGANAPTSFDMRRAFTKIELLSSLGTLFSCSWSAFYDLMRITESQATPLTAFGAGGGAAATASGATDLHFELDGCGMDVLTMLDAAKLSSLTLQLTVSPDASNAFIGGTGAVGVTAVNVTVEAEEYPLMAGVAPFASAVQFIRDMKENTGTAAAGNYEVPLQCGNRTRFVLLQAFDTTGTIPALSDAILDKVTLKVGQFEYMGNVTARMIRSKNDAVRGFNQVGCYLVDLGDDVAAFADFEHVQSAKLQYSTLSTAPATWKVTATQVYVEGLEELLGR